VKLPKMRCDSENNHNNHYEKRGNGVKKWL
jgi:hypothetical protein